MPDQELSTREVEVLELCAAGLSDKQIAERLGISAFTVGNHIHRILRKTDCANRVEAVSHAYREGLLSGRVDVPTAPPREPSPPVAVLPSGTESWRPELQHVAGRLTALFQEALHNPAVWDHALRSLANAFESHLSLITWTDYATSRQTSVTLSGSMPPEWIRRYDRHYVRLSPTWEFIRTTPGDFFGVTDDVDLGADLRSNPFYTEYMQSLDIARGIGWTVFLDEQWACTLFVGQSEAHGPTSPWERGLGTVLFPHIRHEMRRLWRGGREPAAPSPDGLGEDELLEQMTLQNRGIVLLDRKGRILRSNPTAESLLIREHWLLRRRQRFTARDPGDTELLQEAITGILEPAASGVVVPAANLLIRAESPVRPPLRARVSPLPWSGEAASRNGQALAVLLLQELRLPGP